MKWTYVGPDDQIHGPYTSFQMLAWMRSGYFQESLLLRTDGDEQFHTLNDWIRVCGNKIPFGLPIVSWNEQVTENMNQLNSRCTSTPSSGNNNEVDGIRQCVLSIDQITTSAFAQNDGKSIQPNHCIAAPMGPMVVGPPPAPFFSPTNPPPILFPVITSNGPHIPTLINPHFPQRGAGIIPITTRPPFMTNGISPLQLHQIPIQNGIVPDRSSVNNIDSEVRSSTVSDSPDSEIRSSTYRMLPPRQTSDKAVDTTDAPWRPTSVSIGLDPIIVPTIPNNKETQTYEFQIHRGEVERLLSTLLGGLKVSISDKSDSPKKTKPTGFKPSQNGHV